MKKSYIILGAITIFCVIITIALRIFMNNMEVNYEEVNVTVISSESHLKRVGKSRQRVYEVKVKYEDNTYDLENVHDTYSYVEGDQITAYLSNGKLYANIEGVRTSTPLSSVYFIFVFISLILVIGTPVYIINSRKRST